MKWNVFSTGLVVGAAALGVAGLAIYKSEIFDRAPKVEFTPASASSCYHEPDLHLTSMDNRELTEADRKRIATITRRGFAGEITACDLALLRRDRIGAFVAYPGEAANKLFNLITLKNIPVTAKVSEEFCRRDNRRQPDKIALDKDGSRWLLECETAYVKVGFPKRATIEQILAYKAAHPPAAKP